MPSGQLGGGGALDVAAGALDPAAIGAMGKGIEDITPWGAVGFPAASRARSRQPPSATTKASMSANDSMRTIGSFSMGPG
jgi:hypothetical protein